MGLSVETWFAVAALVVSLVTWAASVYATLYTEKAREQLERLPGAWKRVPWKRVALAGWLVSALSAGLLGYLLGRPTVAILVGSSNVKAHLKLPAGTRPIWIDVPSRDAMAALFHAAEYGAKTGANPEALLGLSSYGTEELSTQWGQSTSPEHNQNYWLSIQVGKPPLAILYSLHDDPNDSRYPKVFGVAGSMRVNCSDLNKFFRTTGPRAGINVYMPEPRTGTQRALEEECGFDTKAWPNDHYGGWLHYPPQDIATLQSPFVDLVSVPMFKDPRAGGTERIPECPDLRDLHIEVATVCNDTKLQRGDCGDPENLARADHVVVVKVRLKDRVFKVANPVDCEIAKSLIKQRVRGTEETDAQKPWLDDSCVVHGEPFAEPPTGQPPNEKKNPPQAMAG